MSERQKPWTPGPWELCWEDGKHGVVAEAAGKKLVCIIGNNPDDDKNDTRKANARLIAAAPELVDRLESSNRYLIAERDSFYDSITDSEGNITDPDDGFGLQELDHLIDANRALLARIYGDTPEANDAT